MKTDDVNWFGFAFGHGVPNILAKIAAAFREKHEKDYGGPMSSFLAWAIVLEKYRPIMLAEARTLMNTPPKTYMVIRWYSDSDIRARLIKSGLTMEEAKAHCLDPETNSVTCTSKEGQKETFTYGSWADIWTEDDGRKE